MAWSVRKCVGDLTWLAVGGLAGFLCAMYVVAQGWV